MQATEIGNWSLLPGLTCVLVCVILVQGYAAFRRAQGRRRFASDRFRTIWFGKPSAMMAGLRFLALVLLGIALLDVRWGEVEREVPQRGLEIVFAVDVSRSMLAEDVAPNRLERAKQQIKDMVDLMNGDRVALVAFAGESRQVVPLTNHYEDFKQTLDSLGPEDIPRGGSRLGDAIRTAGNSFLAKTQENRAIVILTDGEDQESQPDLAAEEIKQTVGARIFTIGLGDSENGARIPQASRDRRSGGFVEYRGETVWSKLNDASLKQIAELTGGIYVPAGTKQVDARSLYRGFVANVPKDEFASAKINAYEARYQWFLLPAIVLLLCDAFWGHRASANVG